jgi:hypothetical protein
MHKFTYDSALSAAQIAILKDRHDFAFKRISACGTLKPNEKDELMKKYESPIAHKIETDPAYANSMATAYTGGSEIFIVLKNFFDKVGDAYMDEERSQTLIHEMMHCAGFDHPRKTAADRPFDGGPYYSTPPLQAEICIAGRQSDQGCLPDATGLNRAYLRYPSSEAILETA